MIISIKFRRHQLECEIDAGLAKRSLFGFLEVLIPE